MVGELTYRQVNRHGIWWETPVRIGHEGDGVTVLWWPAGTRYRVASFRERRDHLALLANGGWSLEEREWWGGPGIHVIPDGAPFALWPYRTETDELVAWYCNIQQPLVRTSDAFETDDWTLDVVAGADLSWWQWKDEDELEEGRRVGLYSEEDVSRIRAAGDEVVRLIESNAPIFAAWREWRPPSKPA